MLGAAALGRFTDAELRHAFTGPEEASSWLALSRLQWSRGPPCGVNAPRRTDLRVGRGAEAIRIFRDLVDALAKFGNVSHFSF